MKGEVSAVNVLRQQVKVIVNVGDEKEIREYRADQLRFRRRHGKNKRNNEENKKNDVSAREMKELEKLEKQDEKSRLE